MFFYRKLYEAVIVRLFGIASLESIEKIESNSFKATANNPLRSSSRPAKTNAVPVASSSAGKSLGIVCGVNSVAAIVAEKERESAAKRARVTNTRLTALKAYLEQETN